MKKIMAFVVVVVMILGIAMISLCGSLDDFDISLADSTYNTLLDYHGAKAGTQEKAADEDAAFGYLRIKKVCGQDKAMEFYNTITTDPQMNLGSSFDKKSVFALEDSIVRNYRAGLAAEQRPETTPAPAWTPPEGTDASCEIFSDVPNAAWYAEAINAMYEGGLLKGYDDGLFHPNDYLTYGQWATIMCRVANLVILPSQNETYNHWAGGAYMAAYSSGLSNANGLQNYDANILRGEAIDACYCLANQDKWGLKDKLVKKYQGKAWAEADIADWTEEVVGKAKMISDRGIADTVFWAPKRILQAYNWGITQGDNLGRCNPAQRLTRAEAAQMLYNMGIVREGSALLGGGGIGGGTGSAK